MVVEKLLAYFGVDVDKNSIDGAKQSFSNLTNFVTGTYGKFAAAVSAVTSGAAAALVQDFANQADATNKLARRIGTTAETIQEYDYVAQRSGVSTDLMRNSLEKLQGKVSQAANGNKGMAETLKEVGIEAKSFAKLPLGDQMEAIARGFSKLKTDGDRTRLAMQLFEEEGRGMVTVFEGGADAIAEMRAQARGFGLYSTEEAAAAEAFNDNLLDMQMIIGGIRNRIAVELMPVFNEMLVSFRDWFNENRKIIASGLAEFFKAATWALKGFLAALAIYIHYKVGMAFMSAVKAVKALRAAFVAARIAALAMNAAAMIIPILIGAAIALVILAIQDIYAFFKGEKSITGLIVKSMTEAWGKVETIISNKWDSIVNRIKGLWRDTVNYVKDAAMGMLPDWVIDMMDKKSDKPMPKLSETPAMLGMPPLGTPESSTLSAGYHGIMRRPVPSTGSPNVVVKTNPVFKVDGISMADIRIQQQQDNAMTARDVSKGVVY